MQINKLQLDSLLEKPWLKQLESELKKSYMKELEGLLIQELIEGKQVFPPVKKIFSSLNVTSLSDIKVIILGQDPYHRKGQADGLSFSVKRGQKLPPSLRNIYKEVEDNFNLKKDISNGSLFPWANQGVLLLNSILTVEEGLPGSHSNMGWEEFTDKIIFEINKKKNLVFMLWGTYAKKKGLLIDRSKHLVLESSHPSPLSAYRGFLGNKHFLKCNDYLRNHHIDEIDW